MTALELSEAWVHAAGADTPETYFYSPKTPGIAPDPNGRPQLNLITAGGVAFLQVTGSWGLSETQLKEARSELARKLGRRPEALMLRPAPEQVDGVALVLGDQVLQRSKSSGMSPFHAAFNVTLDADQLKAVQAALGGERGRLGLVYDITRLLPVTSTTAEHATRREVRDGKTLGSAWSSTSAQAESTTTHATSAEVETIRARLDAADWGAGR
jgi:hypothetical protein